MKRTITLSILFGILFIFSSCSPRISTSITKNFAMLDNTQEVKILDLTDEVPVNSELLGEVKIGDTGFSTNCDYETVIDAAKLEARKVGGNAIKIVSHQNPDFVSSCHRITATIYKITSSNVSPFISKLQGDSILQSVQTPIYDTIQVTKLGGGYRYNYKGEVLTLDRLEILLRNNSLALEYFNKAKGSSGIINVLGYAGGFLVGYPLGTLIGGGKPNWTLAAVGCGLIVIAIPIASSADKNLFKAVNVYNQFAPTSRNNNYYDIKLGINQTGVALLIRF